MNGVLARWYQKYFSDPDGVALAVVLVLGFLIIYFMGDMLAPVLGAIVVAYLLEGLVLALQHWKLPRLLAVMIVFLVFMALLIFLLFGLLPLLSRQLGQLVQELPAMIARGQDTLLHLPELYPTLVNEAQIKDVMLEIAGAVRDIGQNIVSFSLITGILTWVIYLVLVPVLVFFFLKDKGRIMRWVGALLPSERKLTTRIWHEMNVQVGKYVRGKFVEILIVGVISYVTFAIMGLNYAMLLGALVGLSVIIPYVGAVVVTVPVLLIAFFQLGWGSEFAYIAIAYLVIQALDGNVLVPLLFSEAVNLHPVAIIIAILVFGGLWGFWGIFFAIPLATLVASVITAWPRASHSVLAAQETEQAISE
ncbi:MAG: AI-2E family transporter [Gammaproteobacteria bacterium]|nr:AI-2E family transporter [Gammaproteobacteria bacterium]